MHAEGHRRALGAAFRLAAGVGAPILDPVPGHRRGRPSARRRAGAEA
jgi:hypothetical protein